MMIVRELWREAFRNPRYAAASLVLATLIFATHVCGALLIASALSAVISNNGHRALVALALLAATWLCRFLLTIAAQATAETLGGLVRAAIRERSVNAAFTPDRIHNQSARDGSLLATLGDGIDGTSEYVAKYIPAVSVVVVGCPLVVLTLAFVTPWAAVAVACTVACAVLGPLAWKRAMTRLGMRHWDSYESLSSDVLDALRGMSTLRVLGDVPRTRQALDDRSDQLRRATERVMRVSLAETGVTDVAVQAGVVIATFTAILSALTGEPAAFAVYATLMLASEAFRPIRDLARHWHSGFLGLSAMHGLRAGGAFDRTALDRPGSPARGDGDEPLRRALHSPAAVSALTVRDLSFRYPDAPHAVLTDVGLTAERGALTVIIGESGAGKSTLFDVITGFLPASGTVRLDGQKLTPQDIAVVAQRPVLFADTVRQNITLHADVSVPELHAACRDSGILDEVVALGDGFDTPVTEAGTSLSGGQRQRLALARALVAKRPVLLVDEPTSALDTQRAREIVETLHRVAEERIVIMITHRLDGLGDGDRVYRLQDSTLTRASVRLHDPTRDSDENAGAASDGRGVSNGHEWSSVSLGPRLGRDA